MKDKYLTVTALTKYIKRKMDTDPHLRNVWIKGEISNLKLHSRGHMYLTIKDDQTRLQAVMFAGNNRFLKFKPENGMHVLIRGEISVFEAGGQYQLYIQQMEPDGIGSLYLAFTQLKEKLLQKGYFSTAYKKPIPQFPRHIGVITSPTGAAVRDIITTIHRRFPLVKVTVIPVLVQGMMAAQSIASGIDKANQINDFDVLIIGRGGGSIEELWSFNEEIVAEAIFQSKIPIISAVGHETDTTISDYVADLRAPTPTAAAELAVPSRQEMLEKITLNKRALYQNMSAIVRHYDQVITRIKESYAFRYPEQLLRQKEQELDRHAERLERSFLQYQDRKQEKIINLYTRLITQHPKRQASQSAKDLNGLTKRANHVMERIVDKYAHQLVKQIDKLSILNPLDIMRRGFALPYSTNSQIIKSKQEVQANEIITVEVIDGQIICRVIEVKEKNHD